MRRSRLLTGDGDLITARTMSRRSWLASFVLGAMASPLLPAVGRSMQSDRNASEAREIGAVDDLAKKAGLGLFSHTQTAHFLGIGDAPERFRESALAICESLTGAFLAHFREKGFKLELPAQRMTVITLKSKDSYRAFLGEDPGKMVGGHYDLDTNRLVMFDFRPTPGEIDLVADPQRVNLLALVHETTHLLCFNTGLLSRQSDVPDWVSEGLATYVELWQKKKPANQIGAVNRPWLSFLRTARSTDIPWIAISDIVADDKMFWDEKTQQLSYAESWLLVHYLLKTPAQLPKFRAFLERLPRKGQGTPAKRVALAEEYLGSAAKLDRELDRYLKRLAR